MAGHGEGLGLGGAFGKPPKSGWLTDQTETVQYEARVVWPTRLNPADPAPLQ